MRKTYMKPRVTFESFSVAANIAANCEDLITTATQGACFPKFGRKNLFDEEYGNTCGYKVIDGTPDANSGYNGACYHVPNEDYNIFNS